MEPISNVDGSAATAGAADRQSEMEAFMAEGMVQVGAAIMTSLGQDLTSSLGSTWDD